MLGKRSEGDAVDILPQETYVVGLKRTILS